jgi:protease YdgD
MKQTTPKTICSLILLSSLCLFNAPSPAIAADAKLHNRLLKLKNTPGNDQRTIVDSTKKPWRAIGRLNRRTGGHCTATVVAPNLALTAAHCLWNKRTRKYLPHQSLHFVAGWSKGKYLFHSKASAVIPAPRYLENKDKGVAAFTHDWAIIKLKDNPVPVTGLISVENFGSDAFQPRGTDKGPYIQAGYSADKRQVLTVHNGCAIWGVDKNLNVALHHCDALPGDSGSPIIVSKSDGTFRLVAIHVGNVATGGTGTGVAVPTAAFQQTINNN